MPKTRILDGIKFYIASTSNEKKLFEYIRLGDQEGVISIMTSTVITAELLNEKFESPILLAVINKDKNMIELLINFFFEANILSPTCNTPLFIATQQGEVEIVKKLLESKIKVVDKHHPNTNTPLFEAIEKGHLDIVDILLKRGADINAKPFPIESVLKLGKPEMLNYFINLAEDESTIITDSKIKKSFSFHFKKKLYNPNLLQIVSNDNSDMVKFLMNDFIKSGHTKLVEGFLKDKLDINSSDNSTNFLKFAGDYEQKDIINALIKNIIEFGEIRTLKDVLHVATNNTKMYSSEKVMTEPAFNFFSKVIGLELAKGTLLKIAASKNNFEAVKTLIKYGSITGTDDYLKFANQGNIKACAYLNKLIPLSQNDKVTGGTAYTNYCNSQKPKDFTATELEKWLGDRFNIDGGLHETALLEREAFGLIGKSDSAYSL